MVQKANQAVFFLSKRINTFYTKVNILITRRFDIMHKQRAKTIFDLSA